MAKNFGKAEEIVTGIGVTADEAKAIVAYREWGDMLVINGVDGRKLEAAKDKMIF
jgi:hypothetical protein